MLDMHESRTVSLTVRRASLKIYVVVGVLPLRGLHHHPSTPACVGLCRWSYDCRVLVQRP